MVENGSVMWQNGYAQYYQIVQEYHPELPNQVGALRIIPRDICLNCNLAMFMKHGKVNKNAFFCRVDEYIQGAHRIVALNPNRASEVGEAGFLLAGIL